MISSEKCMWCNMYKTYIITDEIGTYIHESCIIGVHNAYTCNYTPQNERKIK